MRRFTVATAILVMLAATVIAVAQTAGPDTRFVFIARGDNPIDALAAAPVAGRMDAPVVLSTSDRLADAAREALVAASPDVVILAGGEAALSGQVAADVQSVVPGATVRRVAGPSRYETARELAGLLSQYDPAFAYTGQLHEHDPNDPDPTEPADNTIDDYTFADVQITEDSLGDFEARARVTNNGSTVDFECFTMTFFHTGTVVGTADACVSNTWASGETRTVEFVTSDDYMDWDDWEVQLS